MPLSLTERAGNPAIAAFREAGGPALLVPAQHSGLGATPLQAIRVQRAVGSRSPSLAVASTMHHFSVASLVAATVGTTGYEWMLLEAIARQRLLLASGFAEGRTGQGILTPTLRADDRDGTLVISGSKKPCSLARSMDLLTASVLLNNRDGAEPRLAVALIPVRGARGVTVKPFWNSFALAGAESDEVVLDNVEVPPDLVVTTEAGPGGSLDRLQTVGFLWFEVLMAASYLGMASALVERVLLSGKAEPSVRAGLVVEVDGAMLCLEAACQAIREDPGDRALAQALVCRYTVQDALARAVHRSVEALGGMSYVSADDVAYLAAASAALAFHPPARSRTGDALCDFYAGEPLRIA